ncbi:molybdopterin oxidoreductase family protein [uncultured Marinococcus sp.]|uniref:assimilatory nitrate reductase catalytic subunit NasC n=1 Tax=uncultured Marinococcus sp. TaxID=487012 RepID=UPI002606D41D|nr:molybdopterin oxidoreductase family protein [uncultured Marinococcus sp.]
MNDFGSNYGRTIEPTVLEENRHQAQCPFCSMQCKKEVVEQITTKGIKYKTVGVDNPTTHGRLCVKGHSAYQHAIHEDRITTPMKKVNGRFKSIEWDEALDIIEQRTKDIQQTSSKNALSVYGGGSLTNEESYLLGKFARVGLQTKYIDYNGRFCMSSAASAATKTFGVDRGFTNGIEEIPNAKCIILAGTNIAECQPTIMPYFEEAKQNGAFIIVIDPRVTETAKMADLHLQLKPGEDWSLTTALLKVIFDKNLQNKEFLQNRTEGAEELEAYVRQYSVDELAKRADVPRGDIEQAATIFAEAGTGMIFTARGVEQQIDGHQAVRHFINLALICGHIGKPGSGYGAITGQANGQGGREHGQKSDQLPGYRSIEDPKAREHMAAVWNVNEKDLPGKGVSAYEMMQKTQNGEIKGMFLVGSNPIASNPNASIVKQGLEALDFLVVVDLFISETAEYADLVLPSTAYIEDEGTLTNMEGRVTWRQGDRPAPGQAKHDWEILSLIAARLGKEKWFSYRSAKDIFEELRFASKGGPADYYGITYERIKKENGVFWPCPSPEEQGRQRLFDESFVHDSGRARCFTPEYGEEIIKERLSEARPLYLTTGRVMSHYLTGVQTGKSAKLNARYFESFVEIHPETAEKYGIKENDLVTLESLQGSIVVRNQWSENIRKDTIFVPFHWAGKQNVNRLIAGTLDPVCQMPGFKLAAVSMKPAEAQKQKV